jgi:hypothetical protein
VTDNPNPTIGSANGSTKASPNGSAYVYPDAGTDAGAVAGLAREIEGLRQSIDKLRGLPGRVDHLAETVRQLADTVNTTTTTAPGVTSWLDLPAEVTTAHAVLGELLAWMQMVYLRYPDAAAGLPDCWLWHPDVTEELLWLMQAWLDAYRDDKAAVTLAGDWHDRYRPGVVRRITTSAGRCSLENHQPRDGHPLPGGPVVPVEKAAEQIATWWASSRADPAPAPDEWHLATAAARRRPGARR